MCKNHASAVKERETINVEEYRGELYTDFTNIKLTPQELVDMWEANSKDDYWFMIAHGRGGETWCARILGTDNDTAKDIVVGLVKELIIGSIISEVIPDSIEVLKRTPFMEDKESCDLAGIAIQVALKQMKKKDIPPEFQFGWMD